MITGVYRLSSDGGVDNFLKERKDMATNKDNFNLWFRTTIKSLYDKEHVGFPILMLTFPLLERYLRVISGLKETDRLNDIFYKNLGTKFPAVNDVETAKNFWQVYRNGLLHQATFSKRNLKNIEMPDGWLSGEISCAVKIDSDGHFWVNPVEFAEIVLDTIDKDFGNFEALGKNVSQMAQVKTSSNGNYGTCSSGECTYLPSSHG
jgi:hypothetical protein